MSFYLQSQRKSFDETEELIKYLYEEKDPRALLLECINEDSFVRWVTSNSSPGAETTWHEEITDSSDPDIRIASHLYLLELAVPEYKRRILYICSRLLQQLPEHWLMNHTDWYKTRDAQLQETINRCKSFTSRTAKSSRDYLALVRDLKTWQSDLRSPMLNCYPIYEHNCFDPEQYKIYCGHLHGYFVKDPENREVPVGYLLEQEDDTSRSFLRNEIQKQADNACSVLQPIRTSASALQEKGNALQKTIKSDYTPYGIFTNLFSIVYLGLSALAAAYAAQLLLADKTHASAVTYMTWMLLFAAVLCIQSSIKRLIGRRKWGKLGSTAKEAGTIAKKLEQTAGTIQKNASAWEQKGVLISKGIYYPPVIRKLALQMEKLESGLRKKYHTKKCFLLMLMAWITVVTLQDGLPSKQKPAKEPAAASPASISYHYTAYDDVDPSSLDPVSVSSAQASSTLVSSRGISYDASMAIDQDLSTSWQEGIDGYGLGEWIRLTFEETTPVKVIRMNLGNWSSSDKYQENGRPSSITLVMESDGQELGRMTQNLEDVMDNHCITFDTPVECSSIQFIIEDVYPGTKYEETVISELSLYH